ncbi:RNA polymerase sigma factor [Actinomadura sp. HBU206391]|uniref:RNA polymerase sigma factor n=1 Tax=Actinomadura sp. HBU206391 TaxID=2731692 RepID=UPI00164EFE47|nr:RNA polymerase sigma factor [Actinomadura sp. HBU206391]MBC6457591.1 RNA polymerase sigma factor [Actinomadura sp. HBU206391]
MRRVSDPPHTDDSTVIEQSRRHPERFGEIFDAHFAEIHRYVASRLGPGPAEDVVADTFLTAFHKRAGYDAARGSVRTWLYGIATNLVGKHRRTEVRALRALGRRGPDPDAAEGPEERVAARVSAEGLRPEIAGAIASLNKGDRDVLLLVALAGFSHDEISAALQIPYGTVGSRLNRARRKLREALGGANPMHDQEGPHRG